MPVTTRSCALQGLLLAAVMWCPSSGSMLKRGVSRVSEAQTLSASSMAHQGSVKLKRRQTPQVAPLPNDTISASYWSEVNALLTAAGASTPRPLTIAELRNLAAPPNPWDEVTEERQPYDTYIGSALLGALNSKPTATPMPSQEVVSQTFVAQCPMLVFGSHVYVRAPHCGETMGTWNDPATGRAILRWDQGSHNLDVRWGVDSLMYGNGSTTYMTLSEQFDVTGSSTHFVLKNCLDVTRYTIEERVTSVQQMGHGETTWRQHDSATASHAYFYKYLLWAPNGTVVAETNLFRMNSRQINVTMAEQNNAPGTLIAMASRNGVWDRDGWRECRLTPSGNPRQWIVDFMVSQRELGTVATVMDLRVASAAMIQLIALRDEMRNQESGLVVSNEGWSMWDTVSKFLWIALAVLVSFCFLGAFVWFGGAEYIRKKAYVVQDTIMPKKIRPRRPVFQATY